MVSSVTANYNENDTKKCQFTTKIEILQDTVDQLEKRLTAIIQTIN
jgi:hypothetical protein